MLLKILLESVLSSISIVQAYKHESGRCMLRGQCGQESFFGAQLPCPDNGLASQPNERFRNELIELCGEIYQDGPVCCDEAQLGSLKENLKKAENLISSCPACKTNFFDFFCTFTCSADQSLFIEIEDTRQSNTGKRIATHVSHYVSKESADGFYDSCKNVKFSATNDFVMSLIGGGAGNSTDFLRFLGHKSLLGSPLQIDYPDMVPGAITPSDRRTKNCADQDPSYRCACVDCPEICPELPSVKNPSAYCKIGAIPCTSFVVLLVYIITLCSFVGGYFLHSRINRKLAQNSSSLRLGSRGADLSEDDDMLDDMTDDTKTYWLNTIINHVFYQIGYTSARFPYAFIGTGLLIALCISCGCMKLGIETEPIRLWVSPQSRTAQEKTFFDTTFGPFYRTEQIYLVNDTSPSASVVTFENIKFWFSIEEQIRAINVNGTTFEDVCFKPTGEACVIQSITGYWQGQSENLREQNWSQHFQDCTSQPVNCLPDFQQPLKPNLVLGGYEDGLMHSKAFVSSIVLSNSLDADKVERAMLWEQELKLLLLEAQATAQTLGLRMSFSTEISLEEELNKSTNTDAKIVLISYLTMFMYASLALGGARSWGRRAFIDSKFSLGLFGIVIVLLSVSVSVGIFSLAGIRITLIIAEVIPFLILAVGVDNIFLICHEFSLQNFRYPDSCVEERIASTMGNIGPSIILSATSQTTAFILGALVGMPAVRNFAIYAAGAVFINAVLQIIIFPAALAIDQIRTESNRIDCAPCCRIHSLPELDVDHEGFVSRILRNKYTPFLFKPAVRVCVLMLFASVTMFSIALFPRIRHGLDQKLALPQDSYLRDYFEDLEQYLGTGPPVYFVVAAANATDRMTQQALCGRFPSCDKFSMANILEQERKRPEASYLLEPAGSWIDDFFYWLKPELDSCCRVKKNDHNSFCTIDDSDRQCQACYLDHNPPWNLSMNGLPEGNEFLDYAAVWLESPTVEDCPIAGKATFSDAVVLDRVATSTIAFHTRSFHVPLRSQEDFIHSYTSARRIANDIARATGLNVFPYAVHYVFFEQYETIVSLAFTLVGSALMSVLLISAILLGSLQAALLVTLSVAMIVVNVAGIMALWNISLNALSLVNLVICVGIGVEFCAHFARSYMFPNSHITNYVLMDGKHSEQRAFNALTSVGSSIFSGITMCKFVGVIVLAFTRSKIFEIYYFRMWLALVFIAATHGLVFLPVLFSLFGPDGYVNDDMNMQHDPEWINTANSHYTDALLARGTEGDEDIDYL